jgi:putative ABC transport system ATP-binding protein
MPPATPVSRLERMQATTNFARASNQAMPAARTGRGQPFAPARPGDPADTADPADPKDPVILEGVTRRYGSRRHGVQALTDVTVSFTGGTLTAVVGASGSGKSTLLQCAAGLDAPTSGTVRIGGTDLSGLSRRRLSVLRRRQVGFVFQSLNLVPTLTTAENIALPLRLDGRRVRKDVVARLAEQVGISPQLGRLPHTLSGGQQQRAAIARALITSPDVIFADEPTAALDVATADGVLGLLRQAASDPRRAVVIVTHDPVAASQADRVLVLDGGRIVSELTAPDAATIGAILRLGARR